MLAHCVHLDEEEIAILARTGARPSHNPVSNLKLASGVAPIPEMLDAGITVSLGTDGAVSGNDLDLWLALRLAAMLHKGVRKDARLVSTAQALRMATLAGAETLGVADRNRFAGDRQGGPPPRFHHDRSGSRACRAAGRSADPCGVFDQQIRCPPRLCRRKTSGQGARN